jgi:hypothetical protein
MSQYVETPTKTFTAAGALGQHLRVITSGALALAGAGDVELGTMEIPCLVAGPATVRLRTAQGTQKFVANGAITAGDLVYAAAAGKVGSSGTVLIGEALETASGDGAVIEVLRGSPLGVRSIRQRFSIAEINAGATLLPAIPGRKYRLVDCAMIAIGGAAATATSVDLRGTQAASGVNLVAAAVAGLTQNTLLRAGAANAAILAGGASFAACDDNTAITVAKTGSNVATATHVDFIVNFEIEN